MFTKILYGAAAIGLFISFMKDRSKTRLALKKAWRSFETISKFIGAGYAQIAVFISTLMACVPQFDTMHPRVSLGANFNDRNFTGLMRLTIFNSGTGGYFKLMP